MNYSVAIPSYQRPKKLFKKTLSLLLSRKVPMESILVFLHDHDPYLDEYAEDLDTIGVEYVVTEGVFGVTAQRQAIQEYFPDGHYVVSVDDDLDKCLGTTTPRWAGSYQIEDMDEVFRRNFTRLEEEGLYIWGISPAYNPFFLSPGKYSTGLSFLAFALYGFINRLDHPVNERTTRLKEDYELSLRGWWYDGGVLRDRGVCVRAEIYSEGGISAEGRTWDDVEDSVVLLLEQWPGYVTRAINRSLVSGWPQVQLARRGRTEGHSPDTPIPGLARK